MCWNANVSLNTFLFSTFILLLIIYNNTFTQYKIQELRSIWMYIFVFSFILMQLIEFFIWRNIHNNFYNNFFTLLATLLVLLQPVFSLMIISNEKIKYTLLFTYLLFTIPYIIYKFYSNTDSVVTKFGHLRWVMIGEYNNTIIFNILWFIWLFFFLFGPIYEKMWVAVTISIILLLISFVNYVNDKSFSSMWCWGVNSIMFYYAFILIFYLPFITK